MRLAVFLTLIAALSGCAGLRLADELDGLPDRANLAGVPFHPQTEYHCGPAALATVLEHGGSTVDYQSLVERVYVPGRRGSLQAEMMAAIRTHGRLAYRLSGQLHDVLAEVSAGRPVLVLENQGLPGRPVWHYAVVVGYDVDRNRILLRSGTERELSMSARRWFSRWERAGRWAVAAIEPGKWPANPDRQRWLTAAADFEATADSELASRVWNQTLKRWPEEPIAWLGLGNTAYTAGHYQNASDAYRQLLELRPDHGPGRFNLAVTLMDSGNPCEAAGILQTLVEDADLSARAQPLLRRAQVGCKAEPAHLPDSD
ncbi:PA2778 family cysteine peptidase [Wenzhouxiangella sp. XN201]|uniref:PA2778 family cysteine peptidase n=1 Tax=Wenzhouxiangella sp. XN201 TaxID=2710755 RepID=UPI0013CCABD6|nr:PA2778 family cysteine peptidase [Wenzhouxiangella sp. XN201]